MSVQNHIAGGESVVLERPAVGGVYASLFEKINLNPVSELSALDIWQDAQAMSGHLRGRWPRCHISVSAGAGGTRYTGNG